MLQCAPDRAYHRSHNDFCYTCLMKIDPDHPRAQSLRTRQRLVWGVKQGLTSPSGLIAHGRGEAFDYLLGETTHPFAHTAIEAAAAHLLLAKKPVLSVNGNVAVLSAEDMIRLAAVIPAHIEINLFHYTKRRVQKIESYLKQLYQSLSPVITHPPPSYLILTHNNARTVVLPHIASSRKITLHDGIASADVVLVPLEDGDRAQALVEMGKIVIAIDLNPLSRTAQSATVTIVDNITRALPLLIESLENVRTKKKEELTAVVAGYNNRRILDQAIRRIRSAQL